ncbi:MAG: TlyA family RNA methyltransferase [Lentisphaerae bacterium]|nr:TlyA family RNA methyltransferase [Lentisphaerota bacterium]
MKKRLDILLAERNQAESREQAQRLIQAGRVLINGQLVTKPGHKFSLDSRTEVKDGNRFVSRGGEKLEAAFIEFRLDVNKLICMDIGASTGGFTDCMLQHGALKVFAVDVGKGQLHWKLRNDPHVVVMECVNARYLQKSDIAETPQFAAMDVSFISLTKVMPAVTEILANGGELVTLIKPQFEAGREQVQKGGVVRNPVVRDDVLRKIEEFGKNKLGLKWLGACESPLRGPAGNIEMLAHWRKE